MDVAQVIALAVSVTLAVIGGMAAFGFWLFRTGWSRMERGIEAERTAREAALQGYTKMFLDAFKEERDARDAMWARFEEAARKDRHDARDDMHQMSAKQAAHELYCAREYVSHPRLTEALKPIVEAQERIFTKLDGKADKVHRPIGS